MINCPFCGSENLEGADICEECQNTLTEFSIPRPNTPVEKGLLKDRIESLNPKTPFAVPPETPIGEVLSSMVAESIGCVMVLDGSKLCGIFSEYDALMKVNANLEQIADRPISSVMTPNPVTLEMSNKIAFALQQMHVGGYRHLPVLADGQLAGVISIRDILNYLAARIGVSA